MKPLCCCCWLAGAVLLSWASWVSWAWMSDTCLVLDAASPYDASMQFFWCPRSELTAFCNIASNMTLDLSGVPTDIRALCVLGRSGLVLQPDVFARFHNLRSIYITGVSAVFSGAFRGQANLLLLYLVSPQHTNMSVASKALDDLQSLEKLTLGNCVFSGMAPDVFAGLEQLKSLDVSSQDEEFSELLCRLLNVSTSLETLQVTMEQVVTLTTPNCSDDLSEFPSLHNASVSFPNIKTIARDALKYFKRISNINMPMNELLHHQLLQSGIQQVDHMNLTFVDLKVEFVCYTALAFNITDISLYFETFQKAQESEWDACQSLESVTISSEPELIHVYFYINLSFIHTLRHVRELSVFLNFYAESVDESLSSLCEGQGSPAELMFFTYKTHQNVLVRAGQFACLENLQHLSLGGLHVKTEGFAFKGLHNLQYLFIHSDCHDTNSTMAELSFVGLHQLQTLALSSVMTPVLTDTYFEGLGNLLNLTICCHAVQIIEDFAFRKLGKLNYLDLSDNEISVIKANTFSGLHELQTLLLESNPIKHIQASSFSHFPSLQTLRLSNDKFSTSERWNMQVLKLSLIFGTFPKCLADLSIQSVGPMTLVFADNSAPNVELKLSLFGEQIILLGCERRFVKSVSILHVAADQFLCGPDSTAALGHFSSVVQLRFTQRSLSTVQDLTGLNNLVHLKRLDLQSVNFINLPGLNVMFHNLTRLESLGLYDCWLDSLEGSLAVDLRSLKYLYLYISSETSMTEAFFEPLTDLKSVIIFQLQLRCNCENAWFNDWARHQKRVEVFLFSSQQGALQCQSGGRLEELAWYGREHCSLDVGLVLFVSTAAFLLLFMLAVLVQQLAAEYLLAVFHIAHGWLDEALHRNTRGRYLYDTFVSYSGRDERWVVEQLLPGLERRGPPFLRLCLHSRDFQLGKDVVENITDSLYRSRRTLCLVSRHFLRSNWCSLELRLATYRLQVEHRDVLVLLFLEKIPSRLLTAHHRLARLVKTRTYIDWPQDPAQQEAFWDRLWAKLAPPRD